MWVFPSAGTIWWSWLNPDWFLEFSVDVMFTRDTACHCLLAERKEELKAGGVQMEESQKRHFCRKLGLGRTGSDSTFSRLPSYCRPGNFAVGPVLDLPDNIVHTWWCVSTYEEPHSTRLTSVWILVHPWVQLFSGLSVCHVVLADQQAGCMWQLGIWQCTSDPYGAAAGHISTSLNPISLYLSGYSMDGYKDMHLEQFPFPKPRGKSHRYKAEQRIEEVSKMFPRFYGCVHVL